MKKIAYTAILRLPSYWSEGIIIVEDSKNIRGLFTVDIIEGILKNDIMILEFTKHSIDIKTRISCLRFMNFFIDVKKLDCPSEYSFSSEDYTDCSLEFISAIENPQEIIKLEEFLEPFFPTI